MHEAFLRLLPLPRNSRPHLNKSDLSIPKAYGSKQETSKKPRKVLVYNTQKCSRSKVRRIVQVFRRDRDFTGLSASMLIVVPFVVGESGSEDELGVVFVRLCVR